jgi:uncharacterized phage protein (TIGR02220 family)
MCDFFTQSLYIRLLTLVDDFGRYEANARLLRSHAFPLGAPDGSDIELKAIVSSCEQMFTNQLVEFYECAGKEYLQIVRWQERPRSERSKCPAFDNSCKQMFSNVFKCSRDDSKCSPPSSSSSSSSSSIAILSGLPDAVPLSSWKSAEIQTKSRIVLHHLNEKAGKHFRETEDNLKIIACRLIEVESDTDGIRRMVDRMCQKWLTDPKMNEYLRPSTLFAKGNFGGYYDQRNDAVMAQFTNGKPHEKTLLDKETDRITRQCKTL